jgi:plastocyanin
MSFIKATFRSGLYLPLSFFLLLGLQSNTVPTSPTTHTVEIRQMKFQPVELLVKKGDKVVFINKDMMTHDVREASGKAWRSPVLTPGSSWSMVASQKATYFCSFHPVMKGKILVK